MPSTMRRSAGVRSLGDVVEVDVGADAGEVEAGNGVGRPQRRLDGDACADVRPPDEVAVEAEPFH
jgi:hypothetical protein